MDAARFDKRGYPVVDAATGYDEWAATYEATVATGLDEPLLDGITSVDWRAMHHVVDLACGTGRVGARLAAKGVGAAAEAEIEAAAAHHVEQRRLSGETDRVPEGRHDDGSTKPDPLGVGRPERHGRERVRADHELDRVVLLGEHHLEAALVGHLDEFEGAGGHVPHVVGGIEAFEIDGDGELHCALSSTGQAGAVAGAVSDAGSGPSTPARFLGQIRG